mgnify:CR=1 FL=1
MDRAQLPLNAGTPYRYADHDPVLVGLELQPDPSTVELLGAIHRAAGIPVAVAGNVGTALTGLDVPPETVVVAEASSFQLEDTVRPSAAAAVKALKDIGTLFGNQQALELAGALALADQVGQFFGR